MSSGFGFNINIFETNVVNLAIVWAILGTYLYDYLLNFFNEYQKDIKVSVRDANRRAEESQQRLLEARNAVESARNRAEEIRNQSVQDSEQKGSKIRTQLKNDLQRIQERGDQAIRIERQRTITDITRQITQLALFTADKQIRQSFIRADGSGLKQIELNDVHVQGTFRQLKRWSSKCRLKNDTKVGYKYLTKLYT